MEEKGDNERGLERFLSLPWVSRVFPHGSSLFISKECEGFICVVLSMRGSEASCVCTIQA